MPPEHGSHIGGVVRQSALRAYDLCPRRAVAEAQREFTDYSHAPAALGTAFHLVAETMLRTMRRTGENQIPPQEAVVIMREVTALPDCPHLSEAQLHDLTIMVIQFAKLEWPASRIIALEERLWAEVPCPDGEIRQITGKPDVLIADPPGGAVCLDHKTGWAIPPTPRTDPTRDKGRPFLSDRGTFQLDVNALLIMRSYPAINRVILREYFPRLNEFREAWLDRDDLEHVEQHLGLLAQRFEMSLNGEIVPEPRPGKWCSHCPIARRCPVPRDDRGVGVIDSPEMADAEAQRWQVVIELANDMREAAKAYHDETGYRARTADREVRWDPPIGKGEGKRSFGLHPVLNTNGNGASA